MQFQDLPVGRQFRMPGVPINGPVWTKISPASAWDEFEREYTISSICEVDPLFEGSGSLEEIVAFGDLELGEQFRICRGGYLWTKSGKADIDHGRNGHAFLEDEEDEEVPFSEDEEVFRVARSHTDLSSVFDTPRRGTFVLRGGELVPKVEPEPSPPDVDQALQRFEKRRREERIQTRLPERKAAAAARRAREEQRKMSRFEDIAAEIAEDQEGWNV